MDPIKDDTIVEGTTPEMEVMPEIVEAEVTETMPEAEDATTPVAESESGAM